MPNTLFRHRQTVCYRGELPYLQAPGEQLLRAYQVVNLPGKCVDAFEKPICGGCQPLSPFIKRIGFTMLRLEHRSHHLDEEASLLCHQAV
ncbi:hypothetical protein D3C87_1887480 [compost metagenome]